SSARCRSTRPSARGATKAAPSWRGRTSPRSRRHSAASSSVSPPRSASATPPWPRARASCRSRGADAGVGQDLSVLFVPGGGELGATDSSEENYYGCIGEGFERAYSVAVPADVLSWLPESLATNAERGLCLRSSTPEVPAGNNLGVDDVERSLTRLSSGLL